MKKKTVSVFGMGRFGKLWARILSADFHVKVYSRHGVAPEETGPGMIIADSTTIFDCDAIFFCVAISAFEEVLKQSASHLKKDTLVFDTCSVKVLPSVWMKTHLPHGTAIIATHPMFGPDSYRQMERRLPIVMCNISAAASVFNEWKAYFNTKEMQVEVMTPESHDRTIAYSQGITHYVGRVLGDLGLGTTPIDTHGYRLLVKIVQQTCNDSIQLFFDLLTFNPYTREMLNSLDRSLERIRSAFEENARIHGHEKETGGGNP